MLDQLLGLQSANCDDDDTLVVETDNSHVSRTAEALDLDDLLVQTESLPVVKLPKRIIKNDDTLDLEDLIATGFDAAPSLLAVTVPEEVAKRVHSRSGRISKRDGSKKRSKKEGSSKSRRAVKEAEDVKTLDQLSTRLDTIDQILARFDKLDDGFKDLLVDIDAFDAKLKAVQAQLD